MIGINFVALCLLCYTCSSGAEQHNIHTECGGNLGFASGVITSPKYPDKYPPNTKCYWYIYAPLGQVIDIRFKFLDLEMEDSVSFYNGHRLQEDFVINKYSGIKNQTELSSIFIRSNGNTMLVSFQGNGPFSNRGFISIYWTHVCLPNSYGQDMCNLTCNCIHENSIGCDSISGFCKCKHGWSHKDCSQAACKSTNCQYECKVITTTPWTEQCSCPKRLRTMANSSGLYCSENNGCNTTLSDHSGYLTSPRFPIKFPGCYWRIVTDPGSVLALTFSMEINALSVRCGINYVSIIDEKSVDQPKKQICLNTKGWIQTSSYVMLIVFHGSILQEDAFAFSGRYNSHACPKFTWGFNKCHNKCSCIEQNTKYCRSGTGKCVCKNGYSSHDCSFGTVPSTPCETLNKKSGFLKLRRSRNSNSSISCWLLHGVGISLSKYSNQYVGSFGSYMQKAPLLVYDGNSNASPIILGNAIFLKATGTEMFIEWKESLDDSKDFYLNYTTQSSVCGGTLISSFGHISSPQYPQKYPDYSDCKWTIVVYENQFISLRITDLKLEQQVNCDNDYLDVYDGSSNTAIRIGHFCQSAVPIIVNSTSNFMHILFHTDTSIAERGFHADFQAEGSLKHWAKGCIPASSCEKLNTLYCDINTGQCVCKPGWTGYNCGIEVDLCSSNSCPGNTTCETEDGILSCRSCNVYISSESGHIWSPVHKDLLTNKFCFWTIIGPANSVVTLRFQEFSFTNHFKVVIWNLMVYDGNSTDSTLLGKYIEGGASGIVRSTDNTMHVVLSYKGHEGNGFIAAFSTHACNPFTYGQTCENQCDCETNNTQHCDNLTGFCICKEPWLGHKCTEKKDPCLLQDITFKCPEDQVCIYNNDVHSCVCRQGYVMNSNQQCEVQRACIRNRGLCSHYCIINAVGKEECTCPLNMILGVDKITCVVPFYPNGPDANDVHILRNEADKINTIISEKVNLELAIPFGNHLYDSLYVMSNGVVSFGTSVLPKEPSIAKATELKINLIAPFWTKTNSKKGSIWYNVYKRCGEELHSFKSHSHKQVFNRAAQDIKTLFHLGDFDVQMVLVFTWSDLSPEVSEGNETTSFQMIFVSGYKNGDEFSKKSYDCAECAYALMVYRKDKMNWIYKRNRVIQFGYTIAGGGYLNMTSETDNIINTLPEQALEDTGLKGVWAYQVGSVSSAAQKCQRYTCHHSALTSNAKYQRDINELHRCPCSEDRLGRQWKLCMDRSFSLTKYHYYILSNFAMKIQFANNARNRICTYSSTVGYKWTEREGFHETNSGYVGHILISSELDSKENKLNLKAHDWCCLESNKTALCEKYYFIFPNMGCSNIVPYISALALGDPHFTTLDNMSFTMNGWGEYILMDVQSRSFMLQSRTDTVENENGTVTNATAFVAFAAKEGSAPTFQVELSPDKTTMVIMANESDITKDFYGSLNYSMITDTIDVRRDNPLNRTQVIAVFACGIALVIEVGVENLKVEVEIDKSLKTLTRGLLGNFNGNPFDDFLLPNGTVLSPNITEEEIFYLFASSYLVTQANTIFIYDAGKSYDYHQHPEFTPTFSGSFTTTQINEAAELCGLTSEDCIFDLLVTGNKTVALNTKFLKEEHDCKIKNLANSLPEVKILNDSNIFNKRWLVLENQVNVLNLEATDEDGDTTTMELLCNKPNNIKLYQNGTLIYTPNTQEPVLIGIQAKDSKNAFSAIMYIPITVCPICNGHGLYNEYIVSEKEYLNGQFTILKCLCLPAYTGEYCENELDACKTFPCSNGQNCTDLTAEEQGNMTIGYSCGPCPKGFIDMDMNCLDINECHDASLCDQLCINTEGSYYCQCGNGFVLSASDNSSCIAVAGTNCSTCHCFLKNTHSWLETTGQCICKDGWTGSDCSIKIDNCLNHNCPAHLQCQERKVGYDCVCWNGLKPGPLGTCKDCNRTLSSSNGWIMTSNYPLDYDNDTFCTWTIVSPGPDTTITLSITEYDVEGCPNDYLKIYEGNSTKDHVFGPFCTSAPGILTTTGGAFHVVFTSDFSITRRGFRGYYSIKGICLVEKCSHNCEVMSFSPRIEMCTCPDWMILDTYNVSRCIEINGCNTIITSSGPIATPLFPKFYPENVKCFWNITKGINKEITISFTDFEIEERWDCGYDSVEFLDGPEATSLGKFCGGMAPTITSRNMFLLVVFVSDDSVSGTGFKGTVTIT